MRIKMRYYLGVSEALKTAIVYNITLGMFKHIWAGNITTLQGKQTTCKIYQIIRLCMKTRQICDTCILLEQN